MSLVIASFPIEIEVKTSQQLQDGIILLSEFKAWLFNLSPI